MAPHFAAIVGLCRQSVNVWGFEIRPSRLVPSQPPTQHHCDSPSKVFLRGNVILIILDLNLALAFPPPSMKL
jgi:hypothetical protein